MEFIILINLNVVPMWHCYCSSHISKDWNRSIVSSMNVDWMRCEWLNIFVRTIPELLWRLVYFVKLSVWNDVWERWELEIRFHWFSFVEGLIIRVVIESNSWSVKNLHCLWEWTLQMSVSLFYSNLSFFASHYGSWEMD